MTALSTPGAVTSTTSSREPDGWWTRAACRRADPDAFTPPPDEYRPMKPAEAAYALTYCARCPVAAECLQDALVKGDDYGIRGGIDMAAKSKRGSVETPPVKVPAQVKATAKPAKKRNPTQEARRAADRARAHRRRAEGTEPPCGTRAGYDHHRAIGEPYCDACRNYRAVASQAERDRNRKPSQADTLVPEVLHLVSVGADIHQAARATSKTVGALEKALQRARRHDLLQQLRRTA